MAWFQPSHIDVRQGNATLRGLMVAVLEEAGFTVRARASSPAAAESAGSGSTPADLLVVDVDSDLHDVEEVLQVYRDAARPVLVCGLRASRESYRAAYWLARPFSMEQFLEHCRQILQDAAPADGGTSGQAQATHGDEAERLAQILGAKDVEELLVADTGRLRALLEAPTNPANAVAAALQGLSEDTEDASVEAAQSDSAQEGEVGRAPDFPERACERAGHPAGDAEEFEVIGADDLLDAVSSAPVAPGGEVRGAPVRRRLRSAELQAQLDAVSLQELHTPPAPRPGAQSLTLPEVPAVKLADAFLSEVTGADQRSHPGTTHATPVGQPTTHTSGLYPPAALQPGIAAAADLLSLAWGNIGRLARATDRAAHIRKVLSATLAGGHAAGAREIQRIPAAPGFSGDLASLGLLDLVETIRDRGLRGRLEVSVGRQDFVLYQHAATLDGIENLSGNDDKLLLEILLQMGCLSEASHRALEDSLRDEFAPPLQMQLRGQYLGGDGSRPGEQSARLVGAESLREARRRRAFRLFTELSQVGPRERAEGSFAFIQVSPGGAHAWPVDALGLAVDELIQATRREDSRMNERPASDGFQQKP